jgi:hypothetical protein
MAAGTPSTPLNDRLPAAVGHTSRTTNDVRDRLIEH